jgi:hypothetical protein
MLFLIGAFCSKVLGEISQRELSISRDFYSAYSQYIVNLTGIVNAIQASQFMLSYIITQWLYKRAWTVIINQLFV